MALFFGVVKFMRALFVGLRAAAGVLIIGHGVYRWSLNRNRIRG